ncbi:hypothetical protein B0H17DRAFT_1143821 [Mycena rosella]|uniref:Rhodanese domain-containing protein n=1 Tax=Mycena rosella TaxID=1033263 RepID=A0AAD7G7S2_MYCRO|nr:hypothetical protein B0H17DRAFT_1143821 [Mycena rosella]
MPPQRTLNDILDQVAFELAICAISTAETLRDGVRLACSSPFQSLPMNPSYSASRQSSATSSRRRALVLSTHLFALASPVHLLLTGALPAYIQHALLLTTAALPARRAPCRTGGASWRCTTSCPQTSRSSGVCCGRASRTASASRRWWRAAGRSARRLMRCKGNRTMRLAGARPSSSTSAPRHNGLAHREPHQPRVCVRPAAGAPIFSDSTSSLSAPIPLVPPPAARVGAAPESDSELEIALRAEQEDEALHARPPLIASSYALRPPPHPHLRRRPATAALNVLGLHNAKNIVGGLRAWHAAGLDDGGQEGEDRLGDYISGVFIPSVSFFL